MIKKVVAAAAATGGLVLAGAGMAVADAGAQGAAVQLPGRRFRQRRPGAGPRPGERLRQHGLRDRAAEPRLRQHLRQQVTSMPRPVRVVTSVGPGVRAMHSGADRALPRIRARDVSRRIPGQDRRQGESAYATGHTQRPDHRGGRDRRARRRGRLRPRRLGRERLQFGLARRAVRQHGAGAGARAGQRLRQHRQRRRDPQPGDRQRLRQQGSGSGSSGGTRLGGHQGGGSGQAAGGRRGRRPAGTPATRPVSARATTSRCRSTYR